MVGRGRAICKAIYVPFVEAEQASESPYKAVYAVCVLEPQLVLWNTSMQKLFVTSEAFLPHLSLVYGVLSDATRVEILNETAGLVRELGAVRCNKLQAWSTGNTTDKWELIEEWDLQAA